MSEQTSYEPQGTKIAPWAAEVWNAICESLETDTYHLLQQFIYAMIRCSSQQHALTPEVKRLLAALDLDPGWQKAINLCTPNGKYDIAQLVLILEQKQKKGLAAVMIDKPFMGECQQTENVEAIFDNIVKVLFKSTYAKLQKVGKDMGINSKRELLEQMLDDQMLLNSEAEDQKEMPGFGDIADNRRAYAYGKKTKTYQHRTPDGEARRAEQLKFKHEQE